MLDWLGLSDYLSMLHRKPNLFRVYSKRRSAMQVWSLFRVFYGYLIFKPGKVHDFTNAILERLMLD